MGPIDLQGTIHESPLSPHSQLGTVDQQWLDLGHPVLIDFTVTRNENGTLKRYGHTLLVVGYHQAKDQYVLKNPNQPSPGIEIMTGKELKANWYSRGYSHLANGVATRPLILKTTQ